MHETLAHIPVGGPNLKKCFMFLNARLFDTHNHLKTNTTRPHSELIADVATTLPRNGITSARRQRPPDHPTRLRSRSIIKCPAHTPRSASHLLKRRRRRETPPRRPPDPPRPQLPRNPQLPRTRTPSTPRLRLPLHQLHPLRQPAPGSGRIRTCRNESRGWAGQGRRRWWGGWSDHGDGA